MDKTIKSVLFLCSGNYYRSRFAEYLFNESALKSKLRWRANSRGLRMDARNKGRIADVVQRELGLRGIAIDNPRYPIMASQKDLADAEHIIAVKEAEHRPLMATHFPEWVDRVEFWHIHDIDFAPPDQALPQIEQHVAALVQRLRPSGANEIDGT